MCANIIFQNLSIMQCSLFQQNSIANIHIMKFRLRFWRESEKKREGNHVKSTSVYYLLIKLCCSILRRILL